MTGLFWAILGLAITAGNSSIQFDGSSSLGAGVNLTIVGGGSPSGKGKRPPVVIGGGPGAANDASSFLSIRKDGSACKAAILFNSNRQRAIQATIEVDRTAQTLNGIHKSKYTKQVYVSAGGQTRLGCTYEHLGPPASATTWTNFTISGGSFQ